MGAKKKLKRKNESIRTNPTLDRLLDNEPFARFSVEQIMKGGRSQEEALHIYVNSGEVSELPESLAKYAKRKGWIN